MYLHSVARMLSNGWVRGGHVVLDFSARDIARWRSVTGSRWLGARLAAETLTDFALSVRPDVLALGHADVIDARVIARLRERLPEMKVLQWNVDWLLPPDYGPHLESSGDDNLAKILEKSPVVDATFVSTAGPALSHLAGLIRGQGGGVTGFLPNPADPSLLTARNFERADLPHDLFFAGGSRDPRRLMLGGVRDTGELITALQARLPGVRIDAYGVNGRGPVFGPAYQTALEGAGIGLNISRHNDVELYASDRLAHLAGNGLTVLIERATGYDQLFGDDEFAFYASEDELASQIERLTADGPYRQAIGRAGWARYYRLFDHVTVGRYMLDVLHGEHHPARYEWPTLV